MMTPATSPKPLSLVTCLMFGIFLLLPVTGFFFSWDDPDAYEDQQRLHGPPAGDFQIGSPWTYLEDWTNYFKDHIGFRKILIQQHNRILVTLLKESPVDTVVVGKEGWLFFNNSDVRHSYLRDRPYTEAERVALESYFRELKMWSETTGIQLLFAFPPNKSTIYPEFLPESLRPRDRPSRMDLILTLLHEAGLDTVDLRGGLLAEKEKHLVYFPGDTHWTRTGAHRASQDLLSKIAQMFPSSFDLKAYPPPPVSSYEHIGDLSKMVGLPKTETQWGLFSPPTQHRPGVTVVEETSLPPRGSLRHTRTDRSEQPELQIHHDSFGFGLLPQLAQQFEHMHALYNVPLDLAKAEKEQVDVILVLMVERLLHNTTLLNEHIFRHTRGARSACRIHSHVGECVVDPSSLFGYVRHATEADGEGFITFGLYETLPPGTHQRGFSLKRTGDAPADQPLVRVEIVSGSRILAEKILEAPDLPVGETKDIFLEITLDAPTQTECRVYTAGRAPISVSHLILPHP